MASTASRCCWISRLSGIARLQRLQFRQDGAPFALVHGIAQGEPFCPTGGFLAGYVVMAAIAGWAADRGFDRSFLKLVGALLVAESVLMLMGFAWLSGLIGAEKAWAFGVQPFILVDLVKVTIVAAAGPAIWAVVDAFRKA